MSRSTAGAIGVAESEVRLGIVIEVYCDGLGSVGNGLYMVMLQVCVVNSPGLEPAAAG